MIYAGLVARIELRPLHFAHLYLRQVQASGDELGI
jgi:hypothetical protein